MNKELFIAVASLKQVNGGTASLTEKCDTLGGQLIITRYTDSGDAYSTRVGGGICKLTIE